MEQTTQSYTQDLLFILEEASRRQNENERFGSFLRQQDAEVVDAVVHRLNETVSAVIDCTRCGNCCRSLMINVEPGEPELVAQHLGISRTEFMQAFIEESQQGMMIINTIPCHFLSENKCSIYEKRFAECRQFPHLHKPGFTKNIFMFFMHYHRCPIIYNVVEQLKLVLSFDRN